MESRHWERAKEIFAQALDQAPETRAVFLTTACGDDGDLFQDVSRLLDAHSRSSGALSLPLIPLVSAGHRKNHPTIRPPRWWPTDSRSLA